MRRPELHRLVVQAKEVLAVLVELVELVVLVEGAAA